MSVTIFFGDHDTKQAAKEYARAVNTPFRAAPPLQREEYKDLIVRLNIFSECQMQEKSIVMFEPASAEYQPHPTFARMLERVAMGSDTVVVTNEKELQWLGRWSRERSVPLYYPLDKTHLAVTTLRSTIRNRSTGIGNYTKGHALILGDRPAKRWEGRRPNWLFVSTYLDGTPAWLTEQLEEAKIPETALYWINVQGANEEFIRPRFIDTLRPAKIIALGGVPSDWCKQHNIEERSMTKVHTVPHPSYWSAYFPHRKYQLLDLLSEFSLLNDDRNSL